ncbi:B12-binding domain-containing radical SAM protein [Candidatus Woesearchaeota archaeon]|nr:B12-binding domain-containing radical SAM protein [Candidatus Woesearchaeota archaeon]
MKIQLIHPPTDESYTGWIYEWFKPPPIGLELIASKVESKVQDCSIQILDGNFVSLDEIVEKIDADYVGVSDWYSCHHNVLEILRQAKTRDAITVTGGPNASHLAERILQNNDFVDYVVVGDGEDAFSMLVAGEDPSKIPNLVYRRGNTIVRNKRQNIELGTIFDLEHLDLSFYDRKIPIPISSIRGCVKADQSKRCSFCSIDTKLRLMSPRKVWQQIDLLYNRYGFAYFFETGDSFIAGNYPEKLLRVRPDDFNLRTVRFRIYASPEQITRDTIIPLIVLNVKSIFVGVETVNENILQRAGKRHSKTDVENALKLLNNASIQVQIAIIYGLPGETPETLEETYQFTKDASQKYPKTTLCVSPAIPIVGTELFHNLLANKDVKERYKGDLTGDYFDYKQLTRLQTEHFTSVTFEDVRDYIAKTKLLVQEKSPSFGF